MIVHEKERLDFSKIPESQGIHPAGYWALVIGLIGIFAVGGDTVFWAGYGHMWAKDGTSRTTMRMCLQADDSKCPSASTPQK